MLQVCSREHGIDMGLRGHYSVFACTYKATCLKKEWNPQIQNIRKCHYLYKTITKLSESNLPNKGCLDENDNHTFYENLKF